MDILTTERLKLRELTTQDAAFLVEIMNEPPFYEHIGDKGVRTEVDAIDYMRRNYFTSYRDNGFGLWHVSLREDGTPVGMSGLVKRPDLEAPDIGYGFLQAHWGKGYAVEAGRAVLQYAAEVLKIPRVIALTGVTNAASAKVLERLGMQERGMVYIETYPEGSRLFETCPA